MLTFGSIPIRINPFFWVLILLIGWLNSMTVVGTLLCAAVIFVSVLIHEFGHAFTAMAFKQRVEIQLTGFGGLTTRQGPPLKSWQEFLIVINGPLAGFALCYIAYKMYGLLGPNSSPLLSFSLKVAIYVNLFWTLINLLPVHPLDGGQLFRIILEAMFGVRGVKAALFLSMLVAASIAVASFAYGEIFLGSVFFLLTFENYRTWSSSLSVTDQDRDHDLQALFKEAETNLRQGKVQDAYQQLLQVRDLSKTGVIYTAATDYMARILNESGKYQEAYNLLSPLSKKLSSDSLSLLQQLTFKTGNWEEAIAVGNKVYQHNPGYDSALINAICHAILGHEQPAIGWLKTAISDGLPNPSQVLKKREFDHIRQNPQFQLLLKGKE